MSKTTMEWNACAADSSALNGCWLVTEAHLGGVRLPENALSGLTLHVQSGTFVFGSDHGIITVDRSSRPPALDVIATAGPNAGRFVPAIFEQTGGRLRICFDLAGRDRPTDFTAPIRSNRFLAVYRREHGMTAPDPFPHLPTPPV